MPSIYQIKPRFQALLRPLVRALAAAGVTANQVTVGAAAMSVVAGIVLAAFGMKTVLAHTGEHLDWVTAFALLGGIALYLFGLVVLRWRHVRTLNRHKPILAAVFVVLIPVATAIPGLLTLATATAPLPLLVILEHACFDERRDRLRAHNTLIG